MVSNSELVGEFRGIIDGVLAGQLEDERRQLPEGISTRSTTERRAYGSAYGLQFASIDSGEGHPPYFPQSLSPAEPSEHMWGVSPVKKVNIGKHFGRLAILSFASRTSELFRVCTFDSAMQMISVKTAIRPIDNKLMPAILDWLKSPVTQQEDLLEIAKIGEEEIAAIKANLGSLAETQAQMSEGLARIARQRTQPIPDISLG